MPTSPANPEHDVLGMNSVIGQPEVDLRPAWCSSRCPSPRNPGRFDLGNPTSRRCWGRLGSNAALTVHWPDSICLSRQV